MLHYKLYPFTLLKESCSFTFIFMYLGELLQYYQSSNNLPQSAETLDFDLKSCFVLLNTPSRSTLPPELRGKTPVPCRTKTRIRNAFLNVNIYTITLLLLAFVSK